MSQIDLPGLGEVLGGGAGASSSELDSSDDDSLESLLSLLFLSPFTIATGFFSSAFLPKNKIPF